MYLSTDLEQHQTIATILSHSGKVQRCEIWQQGIAIQQLCSVV